MSRTQSGVRAPVPVVLIASLLTACSPHSEPPPAAAHVSILLRGNGPDPDSLDPQRARTTEAQRILRDLCEGLTILGPNAEPLPGSAREWTVSADGLTYTFQLRPDARWSNGDAVVAEDFVAGLQRLVDPATASEYAQVIDVVRHAADVVAGRRASSDLGVQAPAPHTVVITLDRPAPYLPGLLSHPSTCPVHRPTLARHSEQFAQPGIMVSNGAFVLTHWARGEHVLLTRNTHYWNNAVTRLDRVKYLHIADEAAEFMRYRAGDLHISAAIPRGQLEWIREHVPSELRIAPQLATYYYGFNLDQPVFKDVRVRRALSMAIDRERLTTHILRAGELPAYAWIPPGVHNYTAQSDGFREWSQAQRVIEARRLYAAAGYTAQRPLRFELRYNAGEVHSRLAVAVASMWKEVLGAETRVAAVEFKTLLSDIDRGEVEMFRLSWTGDYDDAYSFAQVLRSDSGVNLPRYRNARYDALLREAAAEPVVVRRRSLLEKAETLMLKDAPVIPLYFYVGKHLVKPEVQGWYDNSMGVVYSKDLSLTQ